MPPPYGAEVERFRERLGVDHHEAASRPGEHHVEEAQTGAVGGDQPRRLHHDHVVELESLRVEAGEHRDRRVDGLDVVGDRAAVGERLGDRRVQLDRRDDGDGAAQRVDSRARPAPPSTSSSAPTARTSGWAPVLRTGGRARPPGAAAEQPVGDVHDLRRRAVVDGEQTRCGGTRDGQVGDDVVPTESAPGRLA